MIRGLSIAVVATLIGFVLGGAAMQSTQPDIPRDTVTLTTHSSQYVLPAVCTQALHGLRQVAVLQSQALLRLLHGRRPLALINAAIAEARAAVPRARTCEDFQGGGQPV